MFVSGSDAILMYVGRVGVTWWWSKFMKSMKFAELLAHGRNNSGWSNGVDQRFVRVYDRFTQRAKPVQARPERIECCGGGHMSWELCCYVVSMLDAAVADYADGEIRTQVRRCVDMQTESSTSNAFS